MAECTLCVTNTEPANYNYICASHHAIPVHKSCIRPLQHCSICNDKILGILQCTSKLPHLERQNVLLSDDMLRRAKIQYKSWHLSRLHKTRQKSMQDTDALSSLTSDISIKSYFSEKYQCIDSEPLPNDATSAYDKIMDDTATIEKTSFSAGKKEIKEWFKTLWWDQPKCSLCNYQAQDEHDYVISNALPETICEYCNIGLCQGHLECFYTKEEWKKVLHFGSPSEPSLHTTCKADGCITNFCKYRIFDDSHQLFDCYDGPVGPVPIVGTCLMKTLDMDYNTSSFVCEVSGCEDCAFCSHECKRKHVRDCQHCFTSFHISKENKKLCIKCYGEEHIKDNYF